MKFETFILEREQSLWENEVHYNLSESGVHPGTINDLFDQLESYMREINTAIDYAGKNKYYRRINTTGLNSTFENTAILINKSIDAMEEAAKYFEGEHDFTSFAKNEEGRNPVINVEYLQIKKEGNLIEIRIKATHFLRYMVRRIIGTLVEVGKGKLKPQEVEEIMEKRDPKAAPYNAKPYGLYLHRVFL